MSIEAHTFLGRPVPVLVLEIEDGRTAKAVPFGYIAEMADEKRWRLRETIRNNADALEGRVFGLRTIEGFPLKSETMAFTLAGVLTLLDIMQRQSPDMSARIEHVRAWVERVTDAAPEPVTIGPLWASGRFDWELAWDIALECADAHFNRSPEDAYHWPVSDLCRLQPTDLVRMEHILKV